MVPVGNFIEITPLPDPQNIIMDRPEYQRALVNEISPDIKPVFNKGSEIMYVASRRVPMPDGQVFLNIDYVVLWKEIVS